MKFLMSAALIFGLSGVTVAYAQPICQKYGDVVQPNNAEILKLKSQGRSASSAGALVSGRVLKNYPAGGSYSDVCPNCPAFQLQIGPASTDTIEIFYTGDARPKINPGDRVTVCGLFVGAAVDYLGQTIPTPDGSFIGDTSDTEAKPYHQDGFMIVNRRLFTN